MTASVLALAAAEQFLWEKAFLFAIPTHPMLLHSVCCSTTLASKVNEKKMAVYPRANEIFQIFTVRRRELHFVFQS
jgi:hypothetical protein